MCAQMSMAVCVGFVQVAICRFFELQGAAVAAGWTDAQRRARFCGHAGQPRVFVLSQYRKQALLCEALLARHPAVTAEMAPCFAVRTALPGLCHAPVKNIILFAEPTHCLQAQMGGCCNECTGR